MAGTRIGNVASLDNVKIATSRSCVISCIPWMDIVEIVEDRRISSVVGNCPSPHRKEKNFRGIRPRGEGFLRRERDGTTTGPPCSARDHDEKVFMMLHVEEDDLHQIIARLDKTLWTRPMFCGRAIASRAPALFSQQLLREHQHCSRKSSHSPALANRQ